jgi:hypothetical protein
MPYENISATVSDQAMAEIKGAIATIHAQLPFLINLTPDERRKRFKMGDKSLAFVRNSVTATQNNPDIVPGNFDIAEFNRDYQLTETVDDTLLAIGSESMASSLLVYDYAKTTSRHSPGIKNVADQLGERFKAVGKRRSKTSAMAA